MPEREPMTQTMTMTDAQRDFGSLVKRVSKKETRIVVEDEGEPVAALVSPDDLDQLKRLDSYREDPWRVIDEIHARNLDKTAEEVERDVAEAIAAVREEDRARRERSAGK